jgi:hypothetical protein
MENNSSTDHSPYIVDFSVGRVLSYNYWSVANTDTCSAPIFWVASLFAGSTCRRQTISERARRRGTSALDARGVRSDQKDHAYRRIVSQGTSFASRTGRYRPGASRVRAFRAPVSRGA